MSFSLVTASTQSNAIIYEKSTLQTVNHYKCADVFMVDPWFLSVLKILDTPTDTWVRDQFTI